MRAHALLAALVLAAGCSVPAALDPAGPQAARIAELGGVFFAVCAAVYGVVLASLALALLRRRPASARGVDEPSLDSASERPALRVVWVAVGVSTLALLGLLVGSVRTGHALGVTSTPGPLVIVVTGHQWWWDVRYPGTRADELVTTANEIHVPVGRTVRIELLSADVIHSFWIPRLHGKRDLIPGRSNFLELRVDAPGEYAGLCAEFCGVQHAHMGILLIAEPLEQFEQWLSAQRASARLPDTPLLERGQRVFLSGSCALCHAIQGTQAQARTGPDLTHVASRRTLAAGALPNGTGALMAWIQDPHAAKPGVRMPSQQLAPQDLEALAAYLGSLR